MKNTFLEFIKETWITYLHILAIGIPNFFGCFLSGIALAYLLVLLLLWILTWSLSPLFLLLIIFIIIPIILISLIIYFRNKKSIKSEKYIAISSEKDEKSYEKTHKEYLEKLNKQYDSLKKRGKATETTLEDLINNISEDHSELYLRLYLHDFKAKKDIYSDEKAFGFAGIFLALVALFSDLKLPWYWGVVVMIMLLGYIFTRPLSPNVKKYSNAVFLLEEALKIKKSNPESQPKVEDCSEGKIE
ncbi:hypothetical protein [Lactococcus cremoris]|uniref:Uncharacterized protein n=1 Tax=Lactococcus lactis subsp. cremoris (strain MG1363) TaxID=416870 RepID=A2RNE0_LACLM|nr:hypothetical protein [Lactococcus cremoris]ADJ61231.1 hypothetical protein LLNZ_11690 [Lactococcus cremoris subsp. cremoris NZ9000]KZK52990.1 hypothetical protein NCDO763_0395 [Lactococcus cremoris]MCT4436359.1 hypothetical protein [Lactococcus cremoris]MCT4446444.1 hypothetical protein [Lactococcus cremoris]MCZ7688249.1 hypothetical protein [Lactococcus cremoris]